MRRALSLAILAGALILIAAALAGCAVAAPQTFDPSLIGGPIR